MAKAERYRRRALITNPWGKSPAQNKKTMDIKTLSVMEVSAMTAEDCKNILLGFAMDNQAKELKKKFNFFRVINPKRSQGAWCKYLHYLHDDEWGYYRVVCDMFVMVVERHLTEDDVINCTQTPAFGDVILKDVNNGGYSVDKKGNGKPTTDVGKIPNFRQPFATDGKEIEITLDLSNLKKSKSGELYQIPAYPVGGGELSYIYMPDEGFKAIDYLCGKLATTKCKFNFENPGGVYFEEGNYLAIVMSANTANYEDEMKEFNND